MSIRKIKALFKKDMKDTSKNINVMILLLLPIMFAVLYTFLAGTGIPLDSGYVLIISTLMNVCMVPTSFLSMIIAEEKEKHTLRTLMLSNVSGSEFLLSKALLTFLYMQVVNIAIFFITKQEISQLPWFLLVISITSLCMIFVGAFAGIAAKDQMSTSIIIVPFMLIFLIPPMFGNLSEAVYKVAKYIPTNAMIEIYSYPQGTMEFSKLWFHFGVIAAWTVLALAAFILINKRKQLDN